MSSDMDLVTHSLNREELNETYIAHAASFGVPVGDRYPQTWWIACLDRRSLPADDSELRLIRAHIEYITRSLYNDTWQKKILDAPLPICSGHNTIVFYKDEASWRYRRATWDMGPPLIPAFLDKERLWSLPELLDHIHGEWRAEEWQQWQKDHPEAFTG